ncbi:PAS domain S-box protein [Roseospirillum parvum]|uniref:histidine kinase n=1 Tax=Roseospirillum parvum TaxID=83401 RepID=A0A1G7UMJ4_9PROT|nr:PAS domain S-box protein [Roseospirillum parvum]SDG48723.1 PAS domain S-box-containing protein [Roseospirillum parvum]
MAASKLRAMIDQLPDFLWEVDAEARYTFASAGVERLLGRAPEAIIGLTPFDLMPPDEAQRIADQFTDIIARKAPFEGLINRNLRPDGREVVLETSGVPLFDAAGTLIGYRGIDRDVTDRLAAETRSRLLMRIFEQSSDMIIVTDPNGVITHVNPAFEALTGWAAEDAVGRTPAMLASGHTPRGVHEDLWQHLQAGREWRGELLDRRRDGAPFWVETAILPIRDERDTITHFVSLQHDITKRKLAELALAEAREKAEVASRAKSDLLANMSHELRTPLNAIIGFSSIMRDGIFGPLANGRYEGYTADIHASASHLLALINDILDMAAVEADRITLFEEDIEPRELIQGSARLLAHQAAQKSIDMTLAIDPGLGHLRGDARRLRQILVNLISNAVKFTLDGGRVSITASRCPRSGDLVIEVEDTGIGMTDSELTIALERFGQVDNPLSRRQPGTGLGLPLAQGLARAHGGRLDLKSRKGEGTRARLRLPAERLTAPATTAPTSTDPERPARVAYLIYRSRPKTLDPAGLSEIRLASERHNQTADLTGALVVGDSFILQYLEGSPEQVDAVFERIRSDPRHDAVEVLDRGETASRMFADWSMKVRRRGDADLWRLSGAGEKAGIDAYRALGQRTVYLRLLVAETVDL